MQCPIIDELMQPAVHTLVLVAQSQAGMWRRNGYSLQNQVTCLIIIMTTTLLTDTVIIIAQIMMAMLIMHMITKNTLHCGQSNCSLCVVFCYIPIEFGSTGNSAI